MSRQQTPHDRLGIFKSLSQVPESRRFHQYGRSYDGEDTWSHYRETVELSDRMSEEWERFSRRWKGHVEEQGRHHALARPKDVETWSATLLDRFTVDRAYQHWNVIEGFYEWLKFHTEHPHTYNPFHMAATESGSNARQIWSRKIEKAND